MQPITSGSVGPGAVGDPHRRSISKIAASRNRIVTGGAGVIGTNLVDALVERGDRVTVVDDLLSEKRSKFERALEGSATLEEPDVRDADAFAELLSAIRPELVFHPAA